MAEAHQIRRCDLQYVRPIGHGGSSTVFEMLWKNNGNKQVAVKRLYKLDKSEVDILLTLKHTNIVQLLGVVDEEMDYMLVLEYCERGSLRSYLDDHSDQPLTPQLFYDWAEQAAKPVKYLKQMRIIHKDIKSANYLITKNNMLKLADFGLSKKEVGVTLSNASLSATPAYMAPELYKEYILSPTYDIFALAVVLWELLTRQVPFKGKENINIMYRVCIENERLPIPPDCPQILANLMKQCWVTERQKRPSIDDMLSTIKEARISALGVHEQHLFSSTEGLSSSSLGSANSNFTPTSVLDLNGATSSGTNNRDQVLLSGAKQDMELQENDKIGPGSSGSSGPIRRGHSPRPTPYQRTSRERIGPGSSGSSGPIRRGHSPRPTPYQRTSRERQRMSANDTRPTNYSEDLCAISEDDENGHDSYPDGYGNDEDDDQNNFDNSDDSPLQEDRESDVEEGEEEDGNYDDDDDDNYEAVNHDDDDDNYEAVNHDDEDDDDDNYEAVNHDDDDDNYEAVNHDDDDDDDDDNYEAVNHDDYDDDEYEAFNHDDDNDEYMYEAFNLDDDDYDAYEAVNHIDDDDDDDDEYTFEAFNHDDDDDGE
ncbi:uncharacterized protein [Amphiura filiformis]|uniref:uncharacterized protein n=1 Tax=Amphiura filiformis TaxID=82378 RepID=UPI003B2136CC